VCAFVRGVLLHGTSVNVAKAGTLIFFDCDFKSRQDLSRSLE
jgi:hypothetical protein